MLVRQLRYLLLTQTTQLKLVVNLEHFICGGPSNELCKPMTHFSRKNRQFPPVLAGDRSLVNFISAFFDVAAPFMDSRAVRRPNANAGNSNELCPKADQKEFESVNE